jgi:RNase P/RNase MRP subunit POP5
MKPSARFKRRYISFMLSEGGKPLAYPLAKEAVHSHFLSFFGESGISSLAFKLMRYDDKSGKGILRVSRDFVEEAVFCMACCKKQRLEPLSTSGSVRRASPSS